MTLRFAAAAVVTVLLGTPVLAGPEYCVSCSGPQRTYRCSVAGPGAIGSEAAHSLYCIQQLAKDGGHATCGLRRAETGPCDGVPKILLLHQGDSLAVGPAPPPLVASPAPTPKADAQPPGTPRTVEEMAKQAATSSNQQIKKAGDTTKNAFTTAGQAVAGAFVCVVTLFQKCKDPKAPAAEATAGQ